MIEAFFLTLVGLVAYQLVGVALFLPFEIAFPKTKLSVFQRADGLIYLFATALVTSVVFGFLGWAKDAWHIPTLVTFQHSLWSPVIAAVVAALYVDLQFYIVHRIEHRFFWRFHAVHHSVRNLSAANSYHHWSESLMGLPLTIPLLLVNIHFGLTMAALAFMFRYQQFYIHSASRPHLGPLRWILIDNRYHRIHHSRDPAHYDKNFGAMSPLWDWLFGTMYMPESSEWTEVGLEEVTEPNSLIEWSSLPWRYAQRIKEADKR